MFHVLSEAGRRVWTTEACLVEDRALVELRMSSKYGTLHVGTDDADGHSGWRFTHVGGAVTLPYVKSARLYVGLLPEVRPNLGPGLHLCALGGFRRPDESHATTAVRETQQEADTRLTAEPVLLPGSPSVSDRNYWITDVTKDEGVKAYAIEVAGADMVTKTGQDYWTHPGWNAKGTPVQFLPWDIAAERTPDALARAAILQLMVYAQRNF